MPRTVRHSGHKKMSKTLLLLFVSMFLVLSLANAQSQEDPEAIKVRALETKLMDAYRQRQIDAFASLLDDDLVITFEDGTTYGKIGYISYTSNPAIQVEVAEMSDLKIRMHGDTAILTGSYHERGQTKGQSYEYRDRFTDVWVKSAGKWRLVASQYAVPAKKQD
jgi:ketosteroid isomerase-like protein